jgi:hypothetical protein
MIAWNGVEKYITNTEVIRDKNEINKLDIQGKSLIGEDWRNIVEIKRIPNYRFKIYYNDLVP